MPAEIFDWQIATCSELNHVSHCEHRALDLLYGFKARKLCTNKTDVASAAKSEMSFKPLHTRAQKSLLLKLIQSLCMMNEYWDGHKGLPHWLRDSSDHLRPRRGVHATYKPCTILLAKSCLPEFRFTSLNLFNCTN